jgi:hypothetical protein
VSGTSFREKNAKWVAASLQNRMLGLLEEARERGLLREQIAILQYLGGMAEGLAIRPAIDLTKQQAGIDEIFEQIERENKKRAALETTTVDAPQLPPAKFELPARVESDPIPESEFRISRPIATEPEERPIPATEEVSCLLGDPTCPEAANKPLECVRCDVHGAHCRGEDWPCGVCRAWLSERATRAAAPFVAAMLGPMAT